MTGHIAFAGFVLTAEEWAELEPELADPLAPAAPVLALGSGPIVELVELAELDDAAAEAAAADGTPVAITLTVTGSVLVGA